MSPSLHTHELTFPHLFSLPWLYEVHHRLVTKHTWLVICEGVRYTMLVSTGVLCMMVSYSGQQYNCHRGGLKVQAAECAVV